jgi:predicted enzyme related to lactoylglutathione lyase
MAVFTSYEPGTFCWIDTGTDPAIAQEFYAAVFGWETEPAVEGTGYTMCLRNGSRVAGLYPLSPEQRAAGVPPHWMSYVSVSDAETTAARIQAAGGTIIGDIHAVTGSGRMGIFIDPAGAMCAIWEPQAHIGAELANEHGTLLWNELLTHDPAVAGSFYANVFGWEIAAQDMPAGTYYVFRSGEQNRAGMMAITPEMGEAPPNWMVYFAVDDADDVAAATTGAGGSIEAPVMEIPGYGRIAVLRDAAGAYFSIMEPAG